MRLLPLRHIALGIFLASSIAIGPAYALDVKGKGDVPYDSSMFSSKPDAETRQKAVRAAKESAWKRYTSTFNAAKLKLYSRVEPEILANLDQYIVDSTVVDESLDKDARVFSVVIRASINETALENKLNDSGGGLAAPGGGQGAMFSFIFVAREAESVKSFDARKTDIRAEEKTLNGSQDAAVRGGAASYGENSKSMSTVTQGGSTLRKADEMKYRLRSAADVDAAMSDVLSSSGFDVVAYTDVVSNCGGTSPDVIKADFTAGDEISPQARKGAIDGARACSVTILAVGTLDVGMQDVDPVSGNQRVYVSVRAQVWDIAAKLPRKIASVGPVQYAGLGPNPEVAGRNALILASKESAKAIVDQLNAKGVR